jgi:hypothetical protein
VIPADSAARAYGSPKAILSPIRLVILGVIFEERAMIIPFLRLINNISESYT